MQTYFKLLTLIVFLLLVAATPAGAATAFDCTGQTTKTESQGLIGKIENRYSAINDMAAAFSQESYLLGADERRYSIGTVKFLKPGRMDWLYGEPDVQRFVADGTNFWWYQPTLSQVTVTDFKAGFSSDLPVSFLLGLGKLSKSFKLESSCRGRRGLVLQLAPLNKTERSLDRFSLVVDGSDYTPIGAKITDAGGNETTIIFTEIVVNSGLSDKVFKFEPPKGIDIVDQRAAGGFAGESSEPSATKEEEQK